MDANRKEYGAHKSIKTLIQAGRDCAEDCVIYFCSMNEPIAKTTEQKIVNILFWLILITGAAMRIHFHFIGRSLWEDEAHIALNFMHLDYKGLTRPLENYQTAPIFFLFSVKFFTDLLGFSPVALRSFPFLISILCYPLFYFFVRDLTKSRPVALIAFLIFGVNASLIYYASEIKSYTVDVCVYIIIGFLTVSENAFVSRNRRLLLAIAGALSLPYSNATPIILVAAGLYLLLGNKEQYFKLKYYWGVFLAWLIAFSVNYYLFIYNHPYGDGMKQIWKDSFAPINIFSQTFWEFMAKRIDDTLFSDMLFLTERYLFPYLTAFLLLVAIVYVIVKKKNDILLFTLLPVAVHLLLSMFKLYPFFFRFILYLLPCIIILLSIGIVAVANRLKQVHVALAGAFILFCCYCSISVSAKKFATMEYPLWQREIKPAINFINTGYHDTHIFITTPLTLYKYYVEIGYAKNNNFEAIDWGISSRQYFEKVSKSETDYLLLYSVDGYADGYGPIIKELEKKHLIVNRMEHGTYGVMEVRPLKDTATTKH